MYLCHLCLHNLKRVRKIELDFTRDGKPRMWTMLIGENGVCKTAILQSIALASSGSTGANQLALGIVGSLPDRRVPDAKLKIEAEFGFGDVGHQRGRVYPLMVTRPDEPPRLKVKLELTPERRTFGGSSSYADLPVETASERDDPLEEVRGRKPVVPHWFVAGYGVERSLPDPSETPPFADEVLDRLRPLFGGRQIIGSAFANLFPEPLARTFASTLKQVLLHRELLVPDLVGLELRGQGGVRSATDLVERHRFEFRSGTTTVKLPATWLSQGYQATIAWIADLVGQILWEAHTVEPDAEIRAEDMEGLVLIDEIDLHLHPSWQVGIVGALCETFPKLQFVVTTHSPMVLSQLRTDEIVRLGIDAQGDVAKVETDASPRLMTGSELYGRFFGIDRIYPADLGERLRRYGYLAANPYRTDEEDAEAAQLQGELLENGVNPGFAPEPRRPLPDLEDWR